MCGLLRIDRRQPRSPRSGFRQGGAKRKRARGARCARAGEANRCASAPASHVRLAPVAGAPAIAEHRSQKSAELWALVHNTQVSSASYVGGEALDAQSDSRPVGSHSFTRVRGFWLNLSLQKDVAANFARNKRAVNPKAGRFRTAYVLAQAPFWRSTSLRISSRR